MTSGLSSTSSSSQVLDFEEFMESLFPEPALNSDSSITKALEKGLSLCLSFWVHIFINLLYHVRNQAEILPFFHKKKTCKVSVEISLDIKKPKFTSPPCDSDLQPKKICSKDSACQPTNLGETLINPISEIVYTPSKTLEETESSQSSTPVTEPETFSLSSSAMCIPHPSKAHTGGEDAHFFTSNACGVFDGVGGWAATGIMDAAAFANGLMSGAKSLAQTCLEESRDYDPQASLQSAFDEVVSRKIGGSSTALILSLQQKGLLRASLVGDSGFVVVRNRQIVYRAPVQQHYFNCPFQLGRDSDKPKDSCQLEFPVEEGDIIVSATDGFWDNFFEEDIVRSLWVWEWSEENRKEEALAQFFCEKAFELSRRRDGLSPFAIASRNAGGHHKGGKTDDVTVVVSRVVRSL